MSQDLDRLDDPGIHHNPCCSAHGEPMTCEKYRRTHFVEVRPCCPEDAARLALSAPNGHGEETLSRVGETAPRVTRELSGAWLCSECRGELFVVLTAYGARATCGCEHHRWTALTPSDEAVTPVWVREKR